MLVYRKINADTIVHVCVYDAQNLHVYVYDTVILKYPTNMPDFLDSWSTQACHGHRGKRQYRVEARARGPRRES